MKSFVLVVAALSICSSAWAFTYNQASPESVGYSVSDNNLTASNDFAATSASAWKVGTASGALVYYWDQGALTKQLGCFPTSAQVPQTDVFPNYQYYFYTGDFAGTLAPGQSITLKIRICDAAGVIPYIQSSVRYEWTNKKNLLKLAMISPAGEITQAVNGQVGYTNQYIGRVLSDSSNSNRQTGEWTIVLKNPTRIPIAVESAKFIVSLYR